MLGTGNKNASDSDSTEPDDNLFATSDLHPSRSASTDRQSSKPCQPKNIPKDKPSDRSAKEKIRPSKSILRLAAASRKAELSTKEGGKQVQIPEVPAEGSPRKLRNAPSKITVVGQKPMVEIVEAALTGEEDVFKQIGSFRNRKDMQTCTTCSNCFLTASAYSPSLNQTQGNELMLLKNRRQQQTRTWTLTNRRASYVLRQSADTRSKVGRRKLNHQRTWRSL